MNVFKFLVNLCCFDDFSGHPTIYSVPLSKIDNYDPSEYEIQTWRLEKWNHKSKQEMKDPTSIVNYIKKYIYT
jgi:hypothetical protein